MSETCRRQDASQQSLSYKAKTYLNILLVFYYLTPDPRWITLSKLLLLLS